ncbi:MAG: polya polymerase, partial [Desulfuromonadaceae bacterium]|nr:polya polymerase [Desulfuromonadaceae bacterium]
DQAVDSFCQRLSIAPRLQHIFTMEREAVHRATNLIFWRRMHTAPPQPSEIYGWFQPLSTEVLLYAMARSANEQVQRCLSTYFTHLRSVQCELVGSDIRQLGISPGPIYKEIFQHLLTARLDGELLTRQDEVDFVCKHYLQGSHCSK